MAGVTVTNKLVDLKKIFNEANAVDALKEYLPLLSETYDAVKKANPAAQVISNGGSGPGGGVGGGLLHDRPARDHYNLVRKAAYL